MSVVTVHTEGDDEAVVEEASLSPVGEAAAAVTVAAAAVELSEQARESAAIQSAQHEAQNIRDNEAWKYQTITLFNSRMEQMEQGMLSALTDIQSSMVELRSLIPPPTVVVAEEVAPETVAPETATPDSDSTETAASEKSADQTKTVEHRHRKHRWT